MSYDRFDVYIKIIRCFDGESTTQYQFAGTTIAVSEKKAINNVRFRIDGKTGNYYSDERGDDWRSREYIAVPAGTDIEEFEA